MIVIGLMIFVFARSGRIVIPKNISFLSRTPQPGTCLLVEEKYCDKAEFVYIPGSRDPILGFAVPEGTPIFSPVDGVTTPIFIDNSDDPANQYRGILVRHFKNPNSTIGLISVNIIGNPLENIIQNLDVKKGEIIGYAAKDAVSAFGDYNLIVSIENQVLIPGTVYSNTGLYIEHHLGL